MQGKELPAQTRRFYSYRQTREQPKETSAHLGVKISSRARCETAAPEDFPLIRDTALLLIMGHEVTQCSSATHPASNLKGPYLPNGGRHYPSFSSISPTLTLDISAQVSRR